MSDSQALALLADPNKVDVGKPKSDEFPPSTSDTMFGLPKENTLVPPPSTSGHPNANTTSSGNVIDLLEDTQTNRDIPSKKPKDEPNKDIFDLSDIQVNESSSMPELPQMTPE